MSEEKEEKKVKTSGTKLKKTEAVKTETVKTETVKTETVKKSVDAAKAGTAKTETTKAGTTKAGTAKTETTKAGTAKAGTAKTETTKAETTKAETTKAETAAGTAAGTAKEKATKTETVKKSADAAKAETTKTATVKKSADTNSLQDLSGLKDLSSQDSVKSKELETDPELAKKRIPRKPDEFKRIYATGRRKSATARVWLKPGSGKISVNKKDISDYFGRDVLRMLIRQPLSTTKRQTQYDVVCTVRGSGHSGQAGAIRHGISRALADYELDLRGVLKSEGYLTRDSRIVERKKYGKAKARRSFQFSKR